MTAKNEDEKKIRIESFYHPLGSENFIDLTISFKGKFYSGLLEVLDNEQR